MASTYLRAKHAAEDRQDELRDRECGSLPGGPEKYRLRIRTTCVPLDPNDPAVRRRRPRRSNGPSEAATRREIAILEKEMNERYPDVYAQYDAKVGDGSVIALSHAILEDMMDPSERLNQPNPLIRFNELAEAYVRQYAIRAGKTLKTASVQRFMILRALLSHLRSSVIKDRRGIASVSTRAGTVLSSSSS